MTMPILTRRIALLGGLCAVSGCNALASLNAAAEPLDTFDLSPAGGGQSGARTSRTLGVALPETSAALATDRILIRPDAVSVAYLPDARWSDEVPLLVQSLMVRSIAQTDRTGYVGDVTKGPITDRVLLVRIDAFEVNSDGQDVFEVELDLDLTVLQERSQRVVGSRRFTGNAPTADLDPLTVVSAFQTALNELLPLMTDWTVRRM